MNSKLCFLTYLIYLLFFLGPTAAQVSNYSNRQPDFEVNSFSQDDDGYIWFATSRGLARYNGTGYLVWNAAGEEDGMLNDNIMSLLYDNQGKMWVGSECGLGYMLDGCYVHNGEHVYNPISSIKEMGPDHILVLGKDGFVKMRKGDFRTVAVHYSIGTSFLQHVLVTDNEDVWFAKSSNDSTYLYVLNKDLDVINKAYLDMGLEVAGICEHPSGDIYLASENRVTYLDMETGNVYDVDALDSVLERGDKIHFMLSYKKDQILLGIAGKGFYIYMPSDGSLRHVIRQQTLSSEEYVCFVDRDDRIWLSDKKSPVRTYNPKGVYIHFNPQGEDNLGEVAHLHFDKEGWLWVNQDGRILSLNSTTGKIRWTLEDESLCRFLFLDSSGYLWAVFGQNDVRQYELRNGRAYLSNKYDIEDDVFSISEGNHGIIWLVSVRKLYAIDKNNGIRTVRPSDVPPFTMLMSDSNTHRVFLFTVNDGLYEIHDDSSVSRIETGGIKGISSIMISSDGYMWIGTYNEGLIRLDESTGKIEKIGKGQGLVDLSVKSIIEDVEGNIWFTTRSDVIKLNPKSGELHTVHDDWFIDGRSYSLMSAISDDEGIVYFSGSAGITRIDTSIPFPQPREKSLRLESITIGGKQTSYDGTLVLNHDFGMLGFRFAGLDYDSGPYLKYSYRLDGRDKNWTYVYGDGSAIYTHLPPGNYIFRVRVSGSDGMWSSDELEIPFKVKRNPTQTSIILFATLAILILSMSLLIMKAKHKEAHKSKMENEKVTNSEEKEGWIDMSSFSEGEKDFMTRMLAVLESNLESDKYTVNDLSHSMGMSYSSLYAKVKSLTDETPQHFMTTFRMRKAEDFLKTGKFSVSEVAYKVGSSSPMTFSREFKKHFGFPPSSLLKDKSAEKGADQNL